MSPSREHISWVEAAILKKDILSEICFWTSIQTSSYEMNAYGWIHRNRNSELWILESDEWISVTQANILWKYNFWQNTENDEWLSF